MDKAVQPVPGKGILDFKGMSSPHRHELVQQCATLGQGSSLDSQPPVIEGDIPHPPSFQAAASRTACPHVN